MDWFGRDIWPNLDGTENLPFTCAANKLMSELCPFWIKKNPSLEIVLLMIGVLEDPFATSDLINRIPTLMRRFISRFKRNNSCLLYTSPNPRDISGSRMPSSA